MSEPCVGHRRPADSGGGRSGKPGPRARAPLTSATARRRAALLTTVAGQLLFYVHEQRETKGGDGGVRAESTRRRSDPRRHLADRAAPARAWSHRLQTIELRRELLRCPTLTGGTGSKNTITGQRENPERLRPRSRRDPRSVAGRLAFTDSYRRQSVAACGGGGRVGHAVRRRVRGAGRAWRAPARHCGAGVRGARRTPLTRAPPAPRGAPSAAPCARNPRIGRGRCSRAATHRTLPADNQPLTGNSLHHQL